MRLKLPAFTLFFLLMGASFISFRIDPNNPPTARTGAPNETTCGASGCHSGGAYTGSVSLSGLPDTVVPGQVYPVTLTNTSNAVRSGFEITCLDANNTKAGTFASATGVNVTTVNGTGRQYARQSTPKNLSNGSTSWTFNWTAPASSNGSIAKFYYVSLCANGNGNKSGDNVFVANKTVVLQTTTPTHEPGALATLRLFPVPATDHITVDLPEGVQQARVKLFDQEGKLLQETTMEGDNALNVSSLAPGTYYVTVLAGNATRTLGFVKG